jgi:hypothetical protein
MPAAVETRLRLFCSAGDLPRITPLTIASAGSTDRPIRLARRRGFLGISAWPMVKCVLDCYLLFEHTLS